MKLLTFHSFLDISSSDVSLLKTETKNLVEHFLQHQPLSRFASATYVGDFSSQKYLYMEESCFNILGYPAEHFLENGFEASLSKWHRLTLRL